MLTALVVVPATAAPDTGVTLYGSNPGGDLFRIDPVTASAELIANPGTGFTEIECDPASPTSAPECFGQFPNGSFQGQLFDPYTGTLLDSPVTNNAAFNGLEYVDGILYGTSITSGGGGASTLQILDPATGDTTPIGPTGVGPVTGLAYDTDAEVMYGVNGGGVAGDLFTVDLETGVVTLVGPTGLTSVGALEFGPDGRLLAGTGGDPDNGGRLYEIDPTTGASTLIGDTGFGKISGLTTYGNTPPVVGDATGTIAEGSEVGTAVATVAVDDADGDPVALEITDGDPSGAFAVDDAGAVTVAGPTSAGTYTLTVTGTDDGTPPLSDTGEVVVEVTDVPPTIASIDLSDPTPAVGSTLAVTVEVGEGITPTEGARVGFAVTGANGGAGPKSPAIAQDTSGTTDADGVVTFSYRGENAGTDQLVAFLDTDGDGILDDDESRAEATATWGGSDDVVRVAGDTRLDTAIEASRNSYPTDGSAGAVVLARGDVFADGLAGAPLALEVDAPLLLTRSDELDADVADEIERVLPAGATVHLLGGPVALSDDVAAAVADLGYVVDRIAGPTRFETAVEIAERLPDASTAFVTRGDEFPDALAAAPAAVRADGVILLSDGEQAHPATTAFLDANGSLSVVAVGGPAATAHPDEAAIVGADRYRTAVEVAERYFDDATVAGLARGDEFADALTGGVHISRIGGPMLLTPRTVLDAATAEFLEDRAASITRVYAYGGSDALSGDVVEAAGRTID